MDKIHPYKYIRFAVDAPCYHEAPERLPEFIKTHIQDKRPNVLNNNIHLPGLFVYLEHIGLSRKCAFEEFADYVNEQLPFPPYNSSGWSGTHFSWFKNNNNKFVYRCFNILDRIKDATPVVLKSDNPGKIVYEDAYQVVVKIDNRRRNIKVYRRKNPVFA